MAKFVCNVCGYVHEEIPHRRPVQSVRHLQASSQSRRVRRPGLQSTL